MVTNDVTRNLRGTGRINRQRLDAIFNLFQLSLFRGDICHGITVSYILQFFTSLIAVNVFFAVKVNDFDDRIEPL